MQSAAATNSGGPGSDKAARFVNYAADGSWLSRGRTARPANKPPPAATPPWRLTAAVGRARPLGGAEALCSGRVSGGS